MVQTEESNRNETIELGEELTQRGNLLQLENLFEKMNDLIREIRRPNVKPNQSTSLESHVSQPKPRGAAIKAQEKLLKYFLRKIKSKK